MTADNPKVEYNKKSMTNSQSDRCGNRMLLLQAGDVLVLAACLKALHSLIIKSFFCTRRFLTEYKTILNRNIVVMRVYVETSKSTHYWWSVDFRPGLTN